MTLMIIFGGPLVYIFISNSILRGNEHRISLAEIIVGGSLLILAVPIILLFFIIKDISPIAVHYIKNVVEVLAESFVHFRQPSARRAKLKPWLLKCFLYYQSREARVLVQLVLDDLEDDLRELKKSGANPIFIRSVIWWQTFRCMMGIISGGMCKFFFKLMPIEQALSRFGVVKKSSE